MPSPYMLFTHRVRPAWRERIPAVVHVDGSARIQTVDRAEEPLVAALLEAVERRTGRAGGGQHQPQHRRAADGRRPPGRARVLRVGAGRRPRPRAVPGPASRLHQAMTFDVVVPTVGRNSLRLLLAALAGADGPAPGRVLVVDDRRDRSAGAAAGRGRRGVGDRRARSRAGGGPKPGLAAGHGRVGRVPGRRRGPWARVAGRPGPRPGGAGGGGRGQSGAGPGADAGRAAADRLGAERPRGWRRLAGPPPTWPIAARCSRRSGGSTSGSRGPTGRTPTSGCGWSGPGTGSFPGGGWSPIRSGRPGERSACGSRRATRTTP